MLRDDPSLLSRPWAAADRARVFDTWRPLVALHMGLFYGGAFFWKLNSAFYDFASSCPSLFFVQLVEFWCGGDSLPSPDTDAHRRPPHCPPHR